MYTTPVEALLATAALVVVVLLVLVVLSRVWVRSSRLGGYQVTHGRDGRQGEPPVPEDDDARWRWGNGKPKS